MNDSQTYSFLRYLVLFWQTPNSSRLTALLLNYFGKVIGIIVIAPPHPPVWNLCWILWIRVYTGKLPVNHASRVNVLVCLFKLCASQVLECGIRLWRTYTVFWQNSLIWRWAYRPGNSVKLVVYPYKSEWATSLGLLSITIHKGPQSKQTILFGVIEWLCLSSFVTEAVIINTLLCKLPHMCLGVVLIGNNLSILWCRPNCMAMSSTGDITADSDSPPSCSQLSSSDDEVNL